MTKKKRQNANYRMFRGMPVRDGTSNIRVQPSKVDIKKAIAGDPTHCAYAECIRRQWNAPNVWIFKTVAYVQLLDENSEPVIERYWIEDDARWFLERFDNGEEVHPAGFVLTPPRSAKTLETIMQTNRMASADRKAKGVVKKSYNKKAQIVGESNLGAAAEPRKLEVSIARSGSGMVHFRTKKDTIKKRA